MPILTLRSSSSFDRYENVANHPGLVREAACGARRGPRQQWGLAALGQPGRQAGGSTLTGDI
ncbi:hypothetical protein E2C01_030380 [Portunus trituberculatus]|uniref:Uncharacterized protein n=1 Tax=Portunus trituberculatus TaxID=210409 RepID=A0A5B7EQP7_PORTR|nr:hypothetical protein [Portunus trituberculatus]